MRVFKVFFELESPEERVVSNGGFYLIVQADSGQEAVDSEIVGLHIESLQEEFIVVDVWAEEILP